MSEPIKTKKKKGTATGKTASESRQNLMAEQTKLVQAENEIVKLLTTINEQINVLKVEELQLRANGVSTAIKLQPDTKPELTLPTSQNITQSYDEINKQNLDLDLIVSNIFDKMEEEESD